MFITQFTVKWGARLASLYHSITQHTKVALFFIQPTSSFLSFSFVFLCPSLILPPKKKRQVTKKQLKIIYYFGSFQLIAFRRKDVE
jgi:hypothetical protein